MSLAMDSAFMRAARPLRISVLLSLCVVVLGCSEMRPARRAAPRFRGGLARIRRIRMQDPVVVGDRSPVGVPAPTSPALQTVVRSTAPPPGAVLPSRPAPARPVTVALQPPATAVEEPPPAVAATPAPAAPPVRDAATSPAAAAPQRDAPPPGAPASPAAEDGLEAVAALVAAGRSKLEAVATYQVRLTRQERVGEALQPAEDVLLSIRRRPKAVRLEWTEGPHKGREVLYSATAGDGLMHIKMANPLVPVPPLALAPDSPLALRTSRHPITEAGLDAILEKLQNSLELSRQGDPATGVVTDGGPETPEALGRPCRKVVRKKPDGETWVVYLDAETHLPALVQATAADGTLLEKYLFRDLRTDLPELASAAAFDPAQRWGRPGAGAGFLNRLARAAATGADPPKAPADTPAP